MGEHEETDWPLAFFGCGVVVGTIALLGILIGLALRALGVVG